MNFSARSNPTFLLLLLLLRRFRIRSPTVDIIVDIVVEKVECQNLNIICSRSNSKAKHPTIIVIAREAPLVIGEEQEHARVYITVRGVRSRTQPGW
jgi:hypothetical protein